MSVYLPWIKDSATGRRRQSKVYWYDFTYLGQRIRESANTTRRSVAENAEYERRKSLEKSATGGKIQLIRQKRLKRVADALGEYERAYAVNHRESGLQIVKERSVHLSKHLGDVIAVDLTSEKILGYMTTRKREGVSNRTVNMEIEVLSRAMEMNFEGVKKLEEARDVGRALPDEEEERLIGAAARSHSPVLHMALRIALATGMRHDEIRLLQMLQIDFEQKHFVVGKAKTEGGEGRVIPFGPELEAALKMYLNRAEIRRGDAAGLVFVSRSRIAKRCSIPPARSPVGSGPGSWRGRKPGSHAGSTICGTPAAQRWRRRAFPSPP